MKLELLDIRALPGIHPGFRLDDFAAGVNFITGPNASGKSSIIRALRYLLDTHRTGDPDLLDLQARFQLDGQQWQVQRKASRIDWELDGHATERPALHDGNALGTWLVTIEDLFKLDSDNERKLAKRLRLELHGGFNLSVLRNVDFPIQLGIGRKERNELLSKQKKLGDIEASQRQISEEEQNLPKLEIQIAESQSASREARDLETAIKLVAARREAAAVEARLELFPEGMDKLLGREAETLDELEREASELQDELDQQTRACEKAQLALRESGLADGRPDEEALQIQGQHLTRLEELEQQLSAEREQHAEASVRLDQAQARLQLEGVDAAESTELDANSLREAQQLAGNLERREADRDHIARQIEGAPENVDERDIERHQRAIRALQDWLSTPTSQPLDLKLPAILAATGALIALVAGLVSIGWLAIVGAGLVAAAIALPWLGSRAPADDARERTRTELAAQGLDGPKAWSRASVQERLGELEHARNQMSIALERRKQADQLRPQLETIEKELQQLQQTRRELAARIGFDPALTTRAMVQFLEDLRTLRQARVDLAQISQSIERKEAKRTGLLAEISPFLQTWLGSEAATTDAAQLQAHLQGLQKRASSARDAEQQLGNAQREIERLTRDLNRTRERIEKLFTDAGLATGQRDELEQRLRQLDDWKELQEQLRDQRKSIASHESALARRPELLAQAENDDSEGLEAALAEANERAEQLAELSNKHGQITQMINEAGNNRAREQALAEVSLARDQLEAIRTRNMDARLAHFLLDEIENEHRRESEPPLLKAAQAAFTAFTHNRWALEIIEGKEIGFRARDVVQGEPRSLAELSTATRMQLLLALRLGQIKIQERGRPSLPLIVDEALTTSDHERAGVIMQTLQQLADEQGRQILYLAAGTHEYHLWEHATGAAPKLIDLGAIRQQRAQGSTPEFRAPERRAIPAPEGMSAPDYARKLGVPALDPREPAGSVHLFHLLPDHLTRLHALMQDWRITTLGQLESLLDSDAARQIIPDAAERELLDQRIRITREWLDAWQVGRAKPLEPRILEVAEAAGILNKKTTYTGVVARAEEIGNDAGALIRNLAEEGITMQSGVIQRLGRNQHKALEKLLRAEGYLTDESPLSPSDLRQRLLIRLSDQVQADRIHHQIDWLESASDHPEREQTTNA